VTSYLATLTCAQAIQVGRANVEELLQLLPAKFLEGPLSGVRDSEPESKDEFKNAFDQLSLDGEGDPKERSWGKVRVRSGYHECLVDGVVPVPVRAASHAASRPTEPESLLTEIVLDLGRPPMAFFGTKRQYLCSDRSITVDQEDIDSIVGSEGVGGYDSFGTDNRAGIPGCLHRISAMKNREGMIYGLTLRVGRTVAGTAHMIGDILFGMPTKSVLVMGEPGSGKTTIVRELARCLAEKENVCIVDTSNEIAGDGDVPHPCVGLARRMMVPSLPDQARVMVECVQNHTPHVMIIDEMGRSNEVAAAQTVKQRGVRIIASAHGDFRKLMKNKQLSGLLAPLQEVIKPGGIPKTKRIGDPTFDVIIELRRDDPNDWTIILDTGLAITCVLEGRPYATQRRTRDSAGQVYMEMGRSCSENKY